MNMGGIKRPGVGEKEVVGQDEVIPKSARQSVEKSNAPSNQITQDSEQIGKTRKINLLSYNWREN